MLIGGLCKEIGRSADTVKRWEEQGLLHPGRDTRGRRVFSHDDVELCRQLARLGFVAQVRNTKLKYLVAPLSSQIAFDFAAPSRRSAA